MYNFLLKRGQLLALLLGVGVTAIYLITVLSGLGSAGYSTSDDLNAILKANPDANFSFFDTGMTLTLALIVIAAAAAVLFGLFQMIMSPKGALKGIIGIAIIAILFFALSSTAEAESTGKIGELVQRFNVSDSVSKYISGGLWTTLILVGASALFMVLGEIRNLFK